MDLVTEELKKDSQDYCTAFSVDGSARVGVGHRYLRFRSTVHQHRPISRDRQKDICSCWLVVARSIYVPQRNGNGLQHETEQTIFDEET